MALFTVTYGIFQGFSNFSPWHSDQATLTSLSCHGHSTKKNSVNSYKPVVKWNNDLTPDIVQSLKTCFKTRSITTAYVVTKDVQAKSQSNKI